jgi:hypothetical protein
MRHDAKIIVVTQEEGFAADLRAILLKIAGGWKHSRLTELMPAEWAAARAATQASMAAAAQ